MEMSSTSDITEDTMSSREAQVESTRDDTQLAPYNHGGDIATGSYFVVFKPGHSMAEHITCMGDSLDPYHIRGGDAGYHVDDLHDAEVILAIRKVPGVESVNQRTESSSENDDIDDNDTDNDPEPSIHSSDEAHSQAASGEAHLAPYPQHEDAITGSYYIAFKSGYSLTQHKTFMGAKLDNHTFYRIGPDYFVEDLYDADLLIAMRKDPGVESIMQRIETSSDDDDIDDNDNDPWISVEGSEPTVEKELKEMRCKNN